MTDLEMEVRAVLDQLAAEIAPGPKGAYAPFTPLTDDELRRAVNAIVAAIGPAGSDRLHAAWGRHLEMLWLKREAELRAAWSQATTRYGDAILVATRMGESVTAANAAGVAALREGEAHQ